MRLEEGLDSESSGGPIIFRRFITLIWPETSGSLLERDFRLKIVGGESIVHIFLQLLHYNDICYIRKFFTIRLGHTQGILIHLLSRFPSIRIGRL